jgi:hypothetical protein
MKRAQLLKPIGGRGEICGDCIDAEAVAAIAAKRREVRDAIIPNLFKTENWSAGGTLESLEELNEAMENTYIREDTRVRHQH